jgi:hypothetical protein
MVGSTYGTALIFHGNVQLNLKINCRYTLYKKHWRLYNELAYRVQ